MAEEQVKLSERVRCSLLSVNRSGLYYKPVVNKDLELGLLILDIWLAHNNKGWRSIQADLREYHQLIVNHKRVRRLMHKLGIHIPRKNTSKADKTQYKYPYGLKNLDVNKSNMVWCSDISYIKLGGGFVYVVAIVDIYSRTILDYEISNTLDVDFCIRCLERYIKKYGTPRIFNTDQGVQYTSNAWVTLLDQHEIMISMDGKGRWTDNVWIERIWRTIKYECVYLNGVETLIDLKQKLNEYVGYYNKCRLHSSLGYKQPFVVYQAGIDNNRNQQFDIWCVYEKAALNELKDAA